MYRKPSFKGRVAGIVHDNHGAIEERLFGFALRYLMSFETLARIARVPLKSFYTREQLREIGHIISI